LRIRYAVSDACQLSHRELLSEWEGAAKEAGIVIAYSGGKRPAPQMSVAALLPQGVTSDDELMDVFLAERISPVTALERLRRHVPAGITLRGVEEVGPSTASLQSQLRWAEYEVEIPADAMTAAEVQDSIDRLLTADSWPAEYRRETRVREYDLRPLVIDVRFEGEKDGSFVLEMALLAEQDNTARADQVVLALGLPEPRRIHRTGLHLREMPASVLAYRRGDGSS
jgi:radical SAM-linked protein